MFLNFEAVVGSLGVTSEKSALRKTPVLMLRFFKSTGASFLLVLTVPLSGLGMINSLYSCAFLTF